MILTDALFQSTKMFNTPLRGGAGVIHESTPSKSFSMGLSYLLAKIQAFFHKITFLSLILFTTGQKQSRNKADGKITPNFKTSKNLHKIFF